MKLKSKRARELAALARQFGREVKLTRNGHFALTAPGLAPVFVAGSPSDWREQMNIRAMLARAGKVGAASCGS